MEPPLAHVHIRVPPEFKRALRVHCARLGVSEQGLVFRLLEAELAREAPDLWPLQPELALDRTKRRMA
jgi:hypothetical protein